MKKTSACPISDIFTYYEEQGQLQSRKHIPSLPNHSIFSVGKRRLLKLVNKEHELEDIEKIFQNHFNFETVKKEIKTADRKIPKKSIRELDRSLANKNDWSLPPNIYAIPNPKACSKGTVLSKIERKIQSPNVIGNFKFYDKPDLISKLNKGWNRYKGKFSQDFHERGWISKTKGDSELPCPAHYYPKNYSLETKIHPLKSSRSPEFNQYFDFIKSIETKNFITSLLGPGHYEPFKPRCPCFKSQTFKKSEWAKSQIKKLELYRLAKFKAQLHPEILLNSPSTIPYAPGNGHTYVFRSKTHRLIDPTSSFFNQQTQMKRQKKVHKMDKKYIEMIRNPTRKVFSIRDTPLPQDEIYSVLQRQGIPQDKRQKMIDNILLKLKEEQPPHKKIIDPVKIHRKKLKKPNKNLAFGSLLPSFEGDTKPLMVYEIPSMNRAPKVEGKSNKIRSKELKPKVKNILRGRPYEKEDIISPSDILSSLEYCDVENEIDFTNMKSDESSIKIEDFFKDNEK